MKEIPNDAVAVRLKNGNVYHPIWPREGGKPGWMTGTCVFGQPGVVGGTYSFNAPQVREAYTANAWEVTKLAFALEAVERSRLADLAKHEPTPEPEAQPTPKREELIAEPPKPRQFPVSIHMVVKATSEEEAERIVRNKMSQHLNGWFVEDTDATAPSPVGSLLWYRYATVTIGGPTEEPQ